MKIEEITSLETLILASKKNINHLTQLKEYFEQNEDENIKLKSLHSLRRIFVNFLENKYFESVHVQDPTKSQKLEKFRSWLLQQYNLVKNELYNLCLSDSVDIQVPAIRTIIEFVRCENISIENHTVFGMRTFEIFIEKIISHNNLDIDILLLIRDEILSKPDCCYHTLLTLRKAINNFKSMIKSQASQTSETDSTIFVQNVLDILRVIPTPVRGKSIDLSLFLVPPLNLNQNAEDEEESSQSDSESDNESETEQSKSKKRSLPQNGSSTIAVKKRRRDYNISEQTQDSHFHLKLFSKVWILFFSLPLTTKQIKLSLKHLPDFVIPVLYQPLLLADYLSNLVSSGGVIGVLALESLFHLIIEYNLDYPNFFNCLYSLLNVEVLSAKYRTKFMNLLHISLKSSNIPEYVVAAFIKKLSVLTLMIPGPAIMFCLSQIVWLLRHHPQCIVMIHRPESDPNFMITTPFDITLPPEACNALQTSLHEIKILQHHYIKEVAEFAKEIERNDRTTSSNPRECTALNVEQYIDRNYRDMIQTELKAKKKHFNLADHAPKDGIYIQKGFISKLFRTFGESSIAQTTN